MKIPIWLKIFTFILLATVFSILLHKSKFFFEENYNSYEIIESNIGVYKVKEESIKTQPELKTQPKLIEQAPAHIFENPTDVIIDAVLQEEPKVNDTTNQEKQNLQSELPQNKPSTPKTLKKNVLPNSIIKNPVFYTYTVQLGAFTTLKDAQSYQKLTLQKKEIANYPVNINKVGKYYKVTLGFFEEINQAQKLCLQLKQDNVQCFATRL